MKNHTANAHIAGYKADVSVGMRFQTGINKNRRKDKDFEFTLLNRFGAIIDVREKKRKYKVETKHYLKKNIVKTY